MRYRIIRLHSDLFGFKYEIQQKAWFYPRWITAGSPIIPAFCKTLDRAISSLRKAV